MGIFSFIKNLICILVQELTVGSRAESGRSPKHCWVWQEKKKINMLIKYKHIKESFFCSHQRILTNWIIWGSEGWAQTSCTYSWFCAQVHSCRFSGTLWGDEAGTMVGCIQSKYLIHVLSSGSSLTTFNQLNQIRNVKDTLTDGQKVTNTIFILTWLKHWPLQSHFHGPPSTSWYTPLPHSLFLWVWWVWDLTVLNQKIYVNSYNISLLIYLIFGDGYI